MARALEALQVSAVIEGAPLFRPRVRWSSSANHPFGALDGLMLLEVLGRVRPDVKLLAISALSALPELREHLLRVDVFGGTRGRVSRRDGRA